MNPLDHVSRKILIGLFVLIPGLFLVAQESTNQDEDEIEELEAFIGNDVPIEDSILPTTRPFESVYGLNRNILETPRNVTIISREQLDAIGVSDVRDFTKLTTSAYTRTNFGAPTTPDIRTQIADQYINGVRRGLTSNGNGLPVNFNAVESVNILKGPATVVHGSSQYVGGYIDLITKRPFFDKARGSVSITAYDWGKLAWNIDYGAPINKNSAFRFSYSGQYDSEGYYENEERNLHAIYGAYSYKSDGNYELFVNGEILWGRYTENFGYNRVTQALIDRREYSTGTNVNNGTVATPDDPQNATNTVSGFPVQNVIAWTGSTQIGTRQRLLAPGDNSDGFNFSVQAIQTWDIDDDSAFVNNTYFNYIKRDTLSSYLYSEIIDPAWMIENRFEYRNNNIEADWIFSKINTGVAIRYQQVKAYNDFFNEPAAVWDLIKQIAGVDYTRSTNYPGFGSAPVPGWEGRFATAGFINGDTGDSSALNIGPFIQWVGYLGENENVIIDLGGRYEWMDTDYDDPLARDALFTPLPDGFSQSFSEWLYNYNASLTWKINESFRLYGTYQESQNPAGAVGNGGGIAGGITAEDLKTEAKLVEGGAKFSFLENTLFASVAVYNQERVNRNQDGSTNNFDTTGFEFETNYQPNHNFYVTFGFTAFDAKTDSPEFYVTNTTTMWDPDANGGQGAEVPRVDFGSFVGNWIAQGSPELKVQGVPNYITNALVNYKMDNGFGFNLGAVFTGRIKQNTRGTLYIPDQYSFNGAVYYEAEKWAARLNIYNLTNERNWAPPNAVYGDESILLEPGRQLELTVSYFWGD